MRKSLADLLAMDAVACRYGCALKPKLRQAIEADLTFPALAASPRPETPVDPNNLPQNVHPLVAKAPKAKRERA
ncbi:hypothetical protein [Ruegeria sp.]|uniref:hypothetical protein n=1 Tax=Ruegeria sp. TaxID=1879320 RepID=UPI003AFF98CC